MNYDPKWAVLLIDMQPEFVDGLTSSSKSIIIPSQIAMIRKVRTLNLPFVVLEYVDSGNTIPELTEEIRYIQTPKYITKSDDDGFKNTDLESYIDGHGVTALLIMGINASSCVFETASHALKLGYEIATSRDLIANHPTEPPCPHDWYQRKGIYKTHYTELEGILAN
jgi:nicotinamidase-related amidase